MPFFSLLQYISLMAYLWPKKLPICAPKYECMDVEPTKKLADKWMQQFFHAHAIDNWSNPIIQSTLTVLQ